MANMPSNSKVQNKPVRKRSMGQCFLEDQNILQFEAHLVSAKDKVVLEIGSGDGRLTEAILRIRPKKIIAVELDPAFADVMRKKFVGMPVRIIEGNILELVPSIESEEKIDIVFGNIPYYISSEIIFTIAKMNIKCAVLMVQKEFAEKMVTKPGEKNYGRLSVTSQIAFDISLERLIPRHLFRPVPKVDSAIILLKPTGREITGFEENIIRWLFQHKNKTVKNALIDSKMFEKHQLKDLGLFAQKRPKTLSKDDCIKIANMLTGLQRQ